MLIIGRTASAVLDVDQRTPVRTDQLDRAEAVDILAEREIGPGHGDSGDGALVLRGSTRRRPQGSYFGALERLSRSGYAPCKSCCSALPFGSMMSVSVLMPKSVNAVTPASRYS